MTKLFFDTNILLDIALERKPHYELSAEIFSSVDSKKITGSISALTCANLYYLISKHASAATARKFLKDLMSIVDVVEVNRLVLEMALNAAHGDFENQIQAGCAHIARADHIVTRDLKDFRSSLVPAGSPEQILRII